MRHAGIFQRFDDRALQRADDVLRRAGRRDQAMPCRRLEAGKTGFVHGRNVWQDGGALERRHRERAHLAVGEKAHHAGRGGEHHLVVAGDDVLKRRRRALIGHMYDVDMGLRFEQFAGQMRRQAEARGREVELAGIGFGERNKLGERMRRHIEIDHQHIGLGADQADRSKIIHRIEADLGVEAGIGGEDRVVAQQQRVTVGPRMGHDFAGDIAARSRPIVDDEGLAEQAAEFVGDDARHNVARAAGRETDDDGDRPFRVVGGVGNSRRA